MVMYTWVNLKLLYLFIYLKPYFIVLNVNRYHHLDYNIIFSVIHDE